ncbi:DNA primase [Bacillus sp. FSL W7-1360]
MVDKIQDEQLAEIRRANDIVEVIGEYVQLTKQGRGHSGLCPFHHEKTPSFSVSSEKQLYHCFGCGAGGNVFTFLQEIEGWHFTEAAHHLARRARIALPEATKNTTHKTSMHADLQVMKEAHTLAAETYHNVLRMTEEGAPGRVYAEERKLSAAQLEHFQIGYAPDHWEALTTIFSNKKWSLSLMAQCGLLSARKQAEGYYDLFRHRLMFPVKDGKGQVIAFGGRAIGADQPKYLNSPETPLFQKGKTLFNLHDARSGMRQRDQVILFEGAFDVIAAWQTGVTNAVATFGTALTIEQATLLRRNVSQVVLCYDGDQAGLEATRKAISVLEGVGCEVKICLLPDGLDPDGFIAHHGAQSFRLHLEKELMSVMMFRMHDRRIGKNLQNEGDRLRYIEEVMRDLAKYPQAVTREYYMRQLADEFGLSIEVLREEQTRFRKEVAQAKRKEENSFAKAPSERKSNIRLPAAYVQAERALLGYMLRDIEMVWRVSTQLTGQFNIDAHQALYAYLLSFVSRTPGANMDLFIAELEDRDLARLAAELLVQPLEEPCSDEAFRDYIKRIEQYPKWAQLLAQKQAIKQAEDPVAAAKLAQALQEESLRLKNEFASS